MYRIWTDITYDRFAKPSHIVICMTNLETNKTKNSAFDYDKKNINELYRTAFYSLLDAFDKEDNADL